MSKKANKESRIKKCIKAPIRVLIKARDCYVRSLTDCSGRMGYGSAIGSCAAVPQIYTLSRSYSANSSASSADEDFRELMRIASRRNQNSPATTAKNFVPRTCSVAIGRIDEEEACDFSEDVEVKTDVYRRRSTSYAVSSKRARLVT